MRSITKTVLIAISTLVLSATALLPIAYAAGTATLYLAPASGSITQGKTITVSVYEDSGSDEVNAVQADLTYSTSKLTYVSYSSGSAFTIEAENPSGNTGSLHFGRGSISPRTGKQLIATVTFRAAASSGTAAVTFANSSAVIRADDNGAETLTKAGGSYTLKASTSTGGGSGSGSGGSSSGGTGGGTSSSSSGSGVGSTKSSDKKAPRISSIKVSAVTDNSATVSWTTSEPATSQVMFGLDSSPSHQLPVTNSKLVTKHKLVIQGDLLEAGTLYHYRVKSIDAAGNSLTSQDRTFVTTGTAPSNEKKGLKLSNNLGNTTILGIIIATIVAIVGAKWLMRRHSERGEDMSHHFPQLTQTNSSATSTTPPPPATPPKPPVVNPQQTKTPPQAAPKK